MSWVKKRGQNATPTAAPPPQIQMYNPAQFNQEQNQWQQPQDNWYNQPKPEANPNWQQNYNQNPQQFGNYPEYYQNNTQSYANLQYNQQYGVQNNFVPPQEGDGWGSNWGWGDEDNSNLQAPSNPNLVTESFTNDESWNWGVDENRKSPNKQNKNEPEIESESVGKRNKLETPQWSIESQVSQESSDDILQTSESDKSRMLSRSSTISHSPISGQDGVHLEGGKGEEQGGEASGFENKENLAVAQKAVELPPMGPPLEDKGNPYKRSTGLSHKAMNQFRGASGGESRAQNVFQPFHVQSVNLETLPDNSEQPDPVPTPPAPKPVAAPNPWAENDEVPINDRNQYLETAQLSDVDLNNYNRAPEPLAAPENDFLPPPGLRRMVPGQTVGGVEPVGPPEGLRRMVPGESSSPESGRPAAAAATTAPDAARSETIGGGDTSPGQGRRDSVEGEVEALVGGVRNMTVGEKKEEGEEGSGRRGESSDSEEVRPKTPERRERRYREKEDNRERDRYRERGRERYSPEDYRDKKYDRRRYRDRRYEEDTDYYSDKDRERRHREAKEYERKYNSLRKDKEKDRRRRDDKKERKGEYYYGRYEEDYENEARSRASSRSDSVHDSYRDRRDRRHREKERHRRHRDPFNPYAQGYGYDIYSQYYQQYQYYENLRKTNPQAYAQLYRKYYQDASGEVSYGGEDRASVHSGRSSANDELAKDRYTRQSYYSQSSLPHLGGYYRGSQTHSISGQYGLDDSSFVRTLDQTDNSLNFEDPNLTAQRLTPAKFATAHIKASISSGKLVKVLPHYPLDGQLATVELCNFESLLQNNEEYQELKRFPGPLVKGTTHKKTIIEYCQKKIREATHVLGDRESYVLMWELLILLIRQNGMVVGADIAELLLKNRQLSRPPSVVSSVGSTDGTEHKESTNLKEEEVTNRFREYLLYGSGKEALEWAMKHGLWGHALFLASKLDKRTYANVMMRFANGLAMNDPLQTLYQLLSGRTPASVTCVADEKWGDWRPHLAMILSNTTQRPELNCKAITVLGDTLMGRGSLYAAQFCYLMAEVGFGQYGSSEAKLVLLGANHNDAFLHFATNDAIHMTEIYEYARSLNDDDFCLASFQRYKYLLATRLADMGLLEKSLAYLEKIAVAVVKNPSVVEVNLINDVSLLADRLKYCDPVGDGEVEVDFDSSRVENSWLKDLRRLQNDFNMGLIPQNSTNTSEEATYVQDQDTWLQTQQQQYEQYQQQNYVEQPQTFNSTQMSQIEYQNQGQVEQPVTYQAQQPQYWPEQQQWGQNVDTAQEQPIEGQSYYGAINQAEPEQSERPKIEEISQPKISLPNQQLSIDHQQPEEPITQEPKKEAQKPKSSEPAQDKSTSSGGGNGWFGGIFNKLSLKPKNQMKLPDDKNPTIVWDPEKKRWVNTDADGGDGGADFKPPPKMADLAPKQPISAPAPSFTPQEIQPQENGSIPKSGPNMYKLQKSRNLKKSYIDVFNPNAKPGQMTAPAPMGGAPLQQPMNFFVPQPVHDPNAPTDFLTPAPPMNFEEGNAQISRWSSASSLSREVQSYTMRKPITRRVPNNQGRSSFQGVY